MALITIGTNLIDVADVALVAPRGAESTVYLADSQQLESALSAAAQAAAVNGTAAGTVLTTVVVSTNFGSCYISGTNTQRVLEAGAGTIWYLRGGPGAVVCPSTDLSTAQTLIDAAQGAGSGVSVAAGQAEPVIDYLDNTAAPATLYAPWTFVGIAGSSTVGIVTITVQFQNALPVSAGFTQFAATDTWLPYPPDLDAVYGVIGSVENATAASAAIDSTGALYVSYTAASEFSNVSGSCIFQYTTGAI